MATALKKLPDEVGSLRLPRVYSLFRYWRKHPPEHELLAAYIGYEEPMTAEDAQKSGAMGLADFFAHAQRTGGKVEGLAPMPGM